MNSDKPRRRAQRGNAMIYILLAIALLGALTMTMMRGNDTGGDDLSKDEAELLATQVVAYAASAKQVVDQMMMTGTPVGSLSFLRPQDAGFDTPPHINKVFHPAGGGLGYKSLDPKMIDQASAVNPGWYMVRFNNVDWTPTTANDVMISAYQINRPVCEAINKRITGSTAIPNTSTMSHFLLGTAHGAAANADFTAAICPTCVGYPSMCISNSSGSSYSFYTIISGQ